MFRVDDSNIRAPSDHRTISCSSSQPACSLCRFIKWSQSTANTNSRRTELLPLLERCTRELQASERYRGDVRYLRVWIQYVRPAPRPPACLCALTARLYLTTSWLAPKVSIPVSELYMLAERRRTVCPILETCLRSSRYVLPLALLELSRTTLRRGSNAVPLVCTTLASQRSASGTSTTMHHRRITLAKSTPCSTRPMPHTWSCVAAMARPQPRMSTASKGQACCQRATQQRI